MRNAGPTEQWITNVRARLAARRNGRPSTKAGAVRALWPEIEQALQNGFSTMLAPERNECGRAVVNNERPILG
jgi:hypothetical protein